MSFVLGVLFIVPRVQRQFLSRALSDLMERMMRIFSEPDPKYDRIVFDRESTHWPLFG